ncbi:MAG: tRNA lysidine(34) synthetase TilS, partial [Candidatus Humimicrobiaceae bacterium]
MQNLVDKVKETITHYCMLEKNDKVLVSISGGPDSVFLLYSLTTLSKELRVNITAFHLDHMTRGGQSKKDALFVKGLCERKGIKLISRKENAKKWSKREGCSFQEGARILRLKYLNEAAMEYNIDKIAIGHNADDNIETLLMNLIRGTGLRGLAGIDPVSGKMIRPLIG